jgi:5-formyltetrahydrofolate cyclo-ligase
MAPTPSQTKAGLRKSLREARREHVAAQSDAIRALLFHRPPGALLEKIGPEAVIGLYRSSASEAPANGYARFFHEQGHTIALPAFASTDAAMLFRKHSDAHGETDLEKGAYGIMQPTSAAAIVVPDIIFVPLIGFTADGQRLGQGGGHYDKWLAAHPGKIAIGLAWDMQLCDTLPQEPHDVALDAIVTPTRLYGPF